MQLVLQIKISLLVMNIIAQVCVMSAVALEKLLKPLIETFSKT